MRVAVQRGGRSSLAFARIMRDALRRL